MTIFLNLLIKLTSKLTSKLTPKLTPQFVQGFTLIELLIALTLFAILSSLTTLLLQNALRTEQALKANSESTQQLEQAVILITQSTRNLVPRAVRGNELHLFPPMIGEPQLLELSQLLNQNPDGEQRQANIIRVAYLCKDNQFIRRRYLQLDTLNRHNYTEQVLLKNLKTCLFSYYDFNLKQLNHWIIDTPPPNIKLPDAIEWKIQFKNSAPIQFLFPITPSRHFIARAL